MGRDNGPVAQRIHRENAERKCLAGFVAWLNGIVGRKVIFANPQSMQQALRGLKDHQVSQRAPQVERFASTKMLGKHLTQVPVINKINVAPPKKGQT